MFNFVQNRKKTEKLFYIIIASFRLHFVMWNLFLKLTWFVHFWRLSLFIREIKLHMRNFNSCFDLYRIYFWYCLGAYFRTNNDDIKFSKRFNFSFVVGISLRKLNGRVMKLYVRRLKSYFIYHVDKVFSITSEY